MTIIALFLLSGGQAVATTAPSLSMGRSTLKCFDRAGSNLGLKDCASAYLDLIEGNFSAKVKLINQTTVEYKSKKTVDVFVRYQLNEANKHWEKFVQMACEVANAYLHDSSGFGLEAILCEAKLKKQYSERLDELIACQSARLKQLGKKKYMSCSVQKNLGRARVNFMEIDESIKSFFRDAFPYRIDDRIIKGYLRTLHDSISVYRQHILNYCAMASFYLAAGSRSYEDQCNTFYLNQAARVYFEIFDFNNYSIGPGLDGRDLY